MKDIVIVDAVPILVGSSGCQIVVTLVHELNRRNKEGLPTKFGLATLCGEGGQGSALILEYLS